MNSYSRATYSLPVPFILSRAPRLYGPNACRGVFFAPRLLLLLAAPAFVFRLAVLGGADFFVFVGMVVAIIPMV